MTLAWHGRRYPSLNDLVLALEARGAVILHADIGEEALFVAGEPPVPPVVILPIGVGPLHLAWLMAHELAHLVKHEGYSSPWAYDRQEHQARIWAATALIPEAAVQRHNNASVDAFVAALSKHYEDLPPYDCRAREIAGIIARVRLSLVKGRQGNNEEAI